MKKHALVFAFVVLLTSVLATPLPAAGLRTSGNVLVNPTLLEGETTRIGTEPQHWVRRGLMDFSNAEMSAVDRAYSFSLTADSRADFPACSSNEGLHWDGAEAGYFQSYPDVVPGETWTFTLHARAMTDARARIFLYAKDAGGRNVAWISDLSQGLPLVWQRLSVTMRLPAGTDSIVAVFRGRACDPGTDTFQFRSAELHRTLF